MSKGKQLEKDFEVLIKEVLQLNYHPANSGSQNGLDGLMDLEINGFKFSWYFECKDSKTKGDSTNVKELPHIKEDLFADKILQIMGERSRDHFPHVFCLVAPHKRLGSNTNLRERLKAWNKFLRFPFKIVIWDFDYLYNKLSKIEHEICKSIYPGLKLSADSNYLPRLLEDIKSESRQGYLMHRSYVKERNYMEGIVSDQLLTIDIYIDEDVDENGHTDVSLRFEHPQLTNEIRLDQAGIEDIAILDHKTHFVKRIAISRVVKADIVEVSVPGEKNMLSEENVVLDLDAYSKYLDSKKLKLIQLLKGRDGGLKKIIKEFIKRSSIGMVAFRVKGIPDEKIASIPIPELHVGDFGMTKRQIFFNLYIEN